MTAHCYTYRVATRQVRSAAADPDASAGRVAQRRRTRAAIIAATQRLLKDGADPSIDEIAAAADVSRRTIYMYFATLDQLVTDATSGMLAEQTVDPVLDSADFASDPVERVDEFARSLLAIADEALPLGRRILRLTVDSEPLPDAPRRGYRRMEWLARVLAPLRTQLTDEQYERLTSALAVVLGWEAMIVLRDVRGLGAADEERVLRWAARTLVTAMVSEAGADA
jgi:AcrR family transcriptional regulator